MAKYLFKFPDGTTLIAYTKHQAMELRLKYLDTLDGAHTVRPGMEPSGAVDLGACWASPQVITGDELPPDKVWYPDSGLRTTDATEVALRGKPKATAGGH